MKITSYSWLLGLLIIVMSCDEPSETVQPILGSMTESVYASVNIVPKDSYFAYSSSPGLIENVWIEEGDLVKAGQSLAKIAADNPNLNIDNAQLNVDLVKENLSGTYNLLSSIRDDIELIQQQVQIDSLNYQRQQSLWNQNIGSKTELENRKLKLDMSRNQLKGLRKKLKQTEIELQSRLEQSKTSLKKAKTTLKDFTIQSKINGKVYSLKKNEGELIGLQEPFAQIGSKDAFIIEMKIDEVDIAQVKLGQLALITLDAYPKEVFEATISKIYPQKDQRTQTFKIEGIFKTFPKALYDGLSGEANIVLSKRDSILTIPIEYLFDTNKVKTMDSTIMIETGIRDMERVEILSGIDTSFMLIKPEL